LVFFGKSAKEIESNFQQLLTSNPLCMIKAFFLNTIPPGKPCPKPQDIIFITFHDQDSAADKW
jgi:hypothetical protein